ncbi:MAG: TylF/MycF/NovP-related O-methyltransferase [Sandaracinaceae bacterium]
MDGHDDVHVHGDEHVHDVARWPPGMCAANRPSDRRGGVVTYGVVVGERGDAARWRDEVRRVRRGPGTKGRALETLRHLVTRDRADVLRFLAADLSVSRVERLRMLRDVARITNRVRGYHTLGEVLEVGRAVLAHGPSGAPRVVECGAGHGGSTAKLSRFVRAVGGRLDVYDTFRGIPANDEQHHLLDGTPVRFLEGAFRGRRGAVERRVRELGAIEVCAFHKGLFEDTLPLADGPVDVALLDVDLIASTRTCLRALGPRMRDGGVIFSQDGHLRATCALVRDVAFWREEVGMTPPRVDVAAGEKLLRLSFERTARL